jgi:hypothetical protein
MHREAFYSLSREHLPVIATSATRALIFIIRQLRFYLKYRWTSPSNPSSDANFYITQHLGSYSQDPTVPFNWLVRKDVLSENVSR